MSQPPPDSSPGALLLVAAKSLQSYVLGSDKLREMVGATQLIEDFCSEQTALEILNALGLNDGHILTGAAGQLTIRFQSAESARRAAALWPWFASRLAPGLEVHVGLAGMENGYRAAVEVCQNQIARSRNRPAANLPAPAPPHVRNPRSGKVAVAHDDEPDGAVLVDAEGLAKRNRREIQNAEVFKLFGLEPTNTAESFEDITRGAGERSYLAVIHADGNGFGQMLMRIGKTLDEHPDLDATAIFQALSQLIRKVGEQAAEAARDSIWFEKQQQEAESKATNEGKPVPPEIVPWLPIVLAGDDLTLVIRADLALEFLKAFIRGFETSSAAKLADFAREHPGLSVPDKLTCGGVIVFCKTAHPFSEAYALCESLAKARAKGKAVRTEGEPGATSRSAIAFHRITASTSHTEFSELRGDELLCSDGIKPDLELCAAPWFVTESQEAFSIERLQALADALRAFPAGSRRQLLNDLRTSRNEADARLRRMIEICRRARGDAEAVISKLEEALLALHGDKDALWCERQFPGKKETGLVSAIPDALTLIEITRESPNP